MNTKFLNIGLSVIVAGMLSSGFTGCGSDDVAEGIVGGVVGDVVGGIVTDADYEAIISDVLVNNTHISCTKTIHGTTTGMGASNKFEVKCSETPSLEFRNDANELTISQVTSISKASATFEDGSNMTYAYKTDFNAGTYIFAGTHSTDGTFNCTEKYDTRSIDKTINNASAIDNFSYFNNLQELSSNCPSWIDDEDDDNIPVKFKITTNTTVSDSTGGTSYIVTQRKN